MPWLVSASKLSYGLADRSGKAMTILGRSGQVMKSYGKTGYEDSGQAWTTHDKKDKQEVSGRFITSGTKYD